MTLLGDAAHTIHPMAGQGVNLGIADCEALVDVMKDAIYSGQDVGDPLILQRYERKQRSENFRMMAAIDLLFRSFSVENKSLAAIRDIGMSTFNWFSPLKNEAMLYAMGSKKGFVE